MRTSKRFGHGLRVHSLIRWHGIERSKKGRDELNRIVELEARVKEYEEERSAQRLVSYPLPPFPTVPNRALISGLDCSPSVYLNGRASREPAT
jgi:hypothetical protein